MGNRAVITTHPYSEDNVGIYVHWNGGRASIEGFLKAAEELGFRGFPDDYGIARLTQIISTYFNIDGLSVGVGLNKNLDTMGDNGVYLVEGWKIVGRVNGFDSESDEEINPAKTAEIARDCVDRLKKTAREDA